MDHTVEIRGLAAQHDADSDPHDIALIRGCLRLTPEERLLRLEQAHEFRAAVREARPYELRER